MKTVKIMNETQQDTYIITKEEALEVLKYEGITESEHMLLRWCRQGKIDAIRVTGVAREERGVFVNSLSLRAFVASKKVRGVESIQYKLEAALLEISELRVENRKLKEEIEALKGDK